MSKIKFDLLSIERCFNCRGCEKDCPSFLEIEGYNPTEINRDILDDDWEKWLDSDVIWQCLECHTCTELCPQHYSWETVMTLLKEKAIELGKAPEAILKGKEMFFRNGRLGDVRMGPRKKLGLPDPKGFGEGDFNKIVSILKEKY